MKRLIVSFTVVLCAVFLLVGKSECWDYEVWRALGRVPVPEALPRAGGPEPIAHAGGAVSGRVYTNSREALEKSLASGYRYVELDLRKTLQGEYFGVHKYREFHEMAGTGWPSFLPPTNGLVEKSRLFGSLHPLFLRDACSLFAEHDAWLVTDKAGDYEALLEACPRPERMIVEVSNLNRYYAALDAGVKYPALNTHDIEGAHKAGVKILVVTPKTYAEEKARDAFLADGGTLLVASSERCSEFAEVFGRDGTWVYTDRCAPARK